MAKKRPSQHLVLNPPIEIKPRIERARREGKYQQALELTKQLYKHEPTAAHKQLLLDVYLGRARQLRTQAATRDAANVLSVAVQLGEGTPTWLQAVAQEFGLCGDTQQAAAVLRQLGGNPEMEARLVAQGVDIAVQQGAKDRVPSEWQADFDSVVQAFAQVEAGQDEQARATLQHIGLRSPLIEWKVLLRGLIAFYQRDDVRALENWQRLNPERVPARLAAPYRFVVDEQYRLAQTPQAQMALQKIADQLIGQGLVPQLRSLQKAFARDGNYRAALRQAETLLPVIRQSQPELLPRLATCFYWELVLQGEPEDVARYQRIFGSPRDDPKFHRVRALVMEKLREHARAHQAWLEYEGAIAADPANWPGEQGTHARALVWLHMARVAMHAEEPGEEEGPFGFRQRKRPQRLSPNTERCLTRSLELAPALLEAHQALFQYHLDHNRIGRARQVGERLLKQFPNQLDMLVAVADIEANRGKHDAAVKLLERALHVNPLDRRLRARLGEAHEAAAMTHTWQGKYDQARAAFQACLALCDPGMQTSPLCHWAVCEFCAGDDARAEELIAQARAQPGNDLAVAFTMLVDVIQRKLPKPLKARFDADFKAALAAPPTLPSLLSAARTVAANEFANLHYPGQKGHEKQLLAYIDRGRDLNFDEEQLEMLCAALTLMKGSRVFTRLVHLGQTRFPDNPYFDLFEAQNLIRQPSRHRSAWKIRRLLERAKDNLRKLPPDEKTKTTQETIDSAMEILNQLDPFSGTFGQFNPFQFFGNPFAADDDEEWGP